MSSERNNSVIYAYIKIKGILIKILINIEVSISLIEKDLAKKLDFKISPNDRV